MWEELHKRLKKLGISIRSIWVADMVHQGQSFALNEDKLGNDRNMSKAFCNKNHIITSKNL